MKSKRKDIKIFLGNLFVFLFIFSLGYILGDGWQRIDGSYFRDALYFLAIFVVPEYFSFLLYLFFKLIFDRSVLKDSLIFGLILGVTVTAFLWYVIKATGGLAEMAILCLPWYFTIAFVLGFTASVFLRSLLPKDKNSMKSKSIHSTSNLPVSLLSGKDNSTSSREK